MGSVRSILRQFREEQDCYQEYQNNQMYEFIRRQEERDYRRSKRDQQRDIRNERIFNEMIDLLAAQTREPAKHTQSLNIEQPAYTIENRFFRSQTI